MTPSELQYKLKSLPPNTPITAEQMIEVLGALEKTNAESQMHAYSTWDNEQLINPEILSQWIGESTNRLKQWRFDGVGPKFVSKAKHVSYKVGDVRDWLNSRTVQSTTEADKKGLKA